MSVLVLGLGSSLAQVPLHAGHLGFKPGSDYKLPNWNEVVSYYRAFDRESARLQLLEIGRSVLGKPLLLLSISSEANLRTLEEWRAMSEALARARIDEDTSRSYARIGSSPRNPKISRISGTR